MKRVMIVDALNAYFRAFIVNPSLSTNGQPIGGLKGFLGILQKLCRDINPDTVMIIWDGPGGSRKRREQNKNYKEGRKPIRVNRQTDLTDEQQCRIDTVRALFADAGRAGNSLADEPRSWIEELGIIFGLNHHFDI